MHSARTVKNIFAVKTVLEWSRWQPQKTQPVCVFNVVNPHGQ